MTGIEALIATLELYIETPDPVSQKFYQQLCSMSKRVIEGLQIKNIILEKFLCENDGHYSDCELNDEDSPRTGHCSCGYEQTVKRFLERLNDPN